MNDLFASTLKPSVGLVVNAPALFARKDFMGWLGAADNRVMSYHPKGWFIADEFSDVTVLVDSNYEGDCSDMPEDAWRAICDVAYAQYGGPDSPSRLDSHIHVRLTNLAA